MDLYSLLGFSFEEAIRMSLWLPRDSGLEFFSQELSLQKYGQFDALMS